ncbi:MAG: hypothetical protein JSW61_13340 [Candidatus Thorarchaeota archaeon]|nr:MAG: hypothetical protein JSW61_13340 [Candidatus Thorarchaeota archaeon]
MSSYNWSNKWVLLLMIGIALQAILYTAIWVVQPPEFTVHSYFVDVMVICFASVVVQGGGFVVIMRNTRGMDPSIYGQGRPFQHKLREEDEELATRKPTFD